MSKRCGLKLTPLDVQGALAQALPLIGPQHTGCTVEAKPLPRIARLNNLKREKQTPPPNHSLSLIRIAPDLLVSFGGFEFCISLAVGVRCLLLGTELTAFGQPRENERLGAGYILGRLNTDADSWSW